MTTRVNFWRTKSGAEVDFVVEKGGQTTPIEVKYSLNPTPGKSLYSFIEKYSPKKAFVLTKDYQKEMKIQNTQLYFVPVYLFSF